MVDEVALQRVAIQCRVSTLNFLHSLRSGQQDPSPYLNLVSCLDVHVFVDFMLSSHLEGFVVIHKKIYRIVLLSAWYRRSF